MNYFYFIIFIIFHFLHNPIKNFNHFIYYAYVKNTQSYYYENMQLEDSNKISLDHIFNSFLYIGKIYKISLNDEYYQ